MGRPPSGNVPIRLVAGQIGGIAEPVDGLGEAAGEPVPAPMLRRPTRERAHQPRIGPQTPDPACGRAQALGPGECSTAIAAGVNLMLTPHTNMSFSRARMLAADGRCKPFDAAANGYVRGEGCGVVVLKRLADAPPDGDPVLAAIRGSGSNPDGARRECG